MGKIYTADVMSVGGLSLIPRNPRPNNEMGSTTAVGDFFSGILPSLIGDPFPLTLPSGGTWMFDVISTWEQSTLTGNAYWHNAFQTIESLAYMNYCAGVAAGGTTITPAIGDDVLYIGWIWRIA